MIVLSFFTFLVICLLHSLHFRGRVLSALCVLVGTFAFSMRAFAAEDFTYSTVISAPTANPVEKKAIAMLLDEAAKRTGIMWTSATSPGQSNNAEIVVARRDQMSVLLPAHAVLFDTAANALMAEGFTVQSMTSAKNHPLLVIAGNDSRGILFGIGYVLRKMEFSTGSARLPEDLRISTAPQYPVRGHQIGYRFKNNTYDAWTVPMFEQHIRDLAVFGNNAIQVIAPNSDDERTSPLYPAPALETLVGICRAAISYGIDFDLYYPEMAKDYSDPTAVEAEVKNADALFKAFPHIDAFYVPGGDPGHTEPKYLLPLIEQEATALHKYHPHATVWMSAQGFSGKWYDEFYTLLRTQRPRYITAFSFIRRPAVTRQLFKSNGGSIPAQYQLQAYPDIAHVMHSQLPLPEWDPAYALTEGREPINPRPIDETEIYRYFSSLHSGFITYSEGGQ